MPTQITAPPNYEGRVLDRAELALDAIDGDLAEIASDDAQADADAAGWTAASTFAAAKPILTRALQQQRRTRARQARILRILRGIAGFILKIGGRPGFLSRASQDA